MALPKAIRFLAVGCVLIFGFLVVQIFRAPSSVKLPGDKATKFDDMVRDPNLDRECWSHCDACDCLLI